MAEPSTPLVGRDSELTALREVLAASRTSAGGAVLIAGDAGVGKTRLLREVIAAAEGGGDLLLLGHCVPVGGETLPYLPIREAFGRLRRTDAVLVAELTDKYPPLRRLVPGGSTEPDPPRLEVADLFEAVLGALLDLATTRPVVLVIEDVHWIDPSSRDLLGFLLTRVIEERVTVLATVRTDDLHRRHPMRAALAEWGRLPGVTRLSLGPLGESALRELVATRHPAPLPEATVVRIFDRSGGNPFFAEQLVAEIDHGNELPADLAQLLLVRYERLPPQVCHVLHIAAVAGRQVPYALLAAVVDLDDVELEGALRQAVDEHVLVATGGQAYEFRHALLAEAVYDDLLPGERVRLHAAFAVALAAAGDRSTDADLARHARESLDVPTAFAASVRAADAAIGVAAPAEALDLYESALHLAAQVPGVDMGELAIKTAAAASLAGHPFRAVKLVEDALSAGTHSDAERAAMLVALAEHRVPLDLPGDLAAHSAAALELLDDEPPTPLRARAMTTHAHALLVTDRPEEALRWATEALNAGRALALPTVIADASTTLARVTALIGEPDAAVHLLERSVLDAAEAGDVAGEIRGWHGLGGRYLEQGELMAAIDAYATACERAAAANRPWSTYALDSRGRQVALLFQTGQLEAALALATVHGAAPPYAEAFLRTMGLAVLVARGDDGVEEALTASRSWADRDGMIGINAAFAEIDDLARRGDLARAIEVHDAAVAVLSRQWQQTWFAGRIRLHALLLGALAQGARASGEVARARRLHADAHRTADEVARRQPFVGPEAAAWVARADAEWAWFRHHTGIDAPSAAELVDTWTVAVDAFGYGQRYEQTRTRIRLAAVLTVVGDTTAAREHSERALADARAMGATPLVAALRARAPKTTSAELTAREAQVLGLLADGHTNRQIGTRLYITDKTASVHVSNILAKLGASSRTEAAAIARRDGLLD